MSWLKFIARAQRWLADLPVYDQALIVAALLWISAAALGLGVMLLESAP
jgi:hypothetical protein